MCRIYNKENDKYLLRDIKRSMNKQMERCDDFLKVNSKVYNKFFSKEIF